MGPKVGAAVPLSVGVSWHNVAWAEAYLRTKWPVPAADANALEAPSQIQLSGSVFNIQEKNNSVFSYTVCTMHTYTCVHTHRTNTTTKYFKFKQPRAALRLVRARVLCQMRAPYRPITAHKNFPLPPIAGPQSCGPGCCSTLAPSPQLMRH